MGRNRINILVSPAVPGIIFIGSSESDTGTSCKLPEAKEDKVIETANWDENNEFHGKRMYIGYNVNIPRFLTLHFDRVVNSCFEVLRRFIIGSITTCSSHHIF